MKTPILTLAALTLHTFLLAAPADHIGRHLARVELLDGTVHLDAAIIAADADGITIQSGDDDPVTISRYLLQPAHRVALDYPEDAHIVPRTAAFRITQTLKSGYIARRYTAPAASGGLQSLTNQIFNRPADSNDQGTESPTSIHLRGIISDPPADGDILTITYIDAGDTRKLTDANTGAPRTLREYIILRASP